MIDVTFPYCSGLDVQKKTVVACVLTPSNESGGVKKRIKSFGTTTAGLEALAAVAEHERCDACGDGIHRCLLETCI